MKRIVTLIIAGLIAGSSMLAAQDLGVGFERAATAAEGASEGIALRLDLFDVLGESVYVVTTSAGEQIFVSATTGRVQNVESATPVDGTPGGVARQMGSRGAMTALGPLLETGGADIDFDKLIQSAGREASRQDVRSVGIGRSGGTIVARVAFGNHSRFTTVDGEDAPLMVVVDVESNEAVDLVQSGTMGRFAAAGSVGPGRPASRFPPQSTPRDGVGGRSPGGNRRSGR